jgi:hypothetical protein
MNIGVFIAKAMAIAYFFRINVGFGFAQPTEIVMS